MRALSRREVLAAAAGLSSLSHFPFPGVAAGRAEAATPRTRFDAATPEGGAMLKKYAQALQKMMDPTAIAEGNPKSWLFQWYTHAVAANTSLQNEIARVYGGSASTDPNRLLALATWNTCQPHRRNGLVQQESMFLPWHRMYISFFEEIIRSVLGDDTFTLPYWDYTTAGKASIPQEFRMKDDPVFKVLYRDNRNDGVNDGKPIDQDDPSILNLDSVKEAEYLPAAGVARGFNDVLQHELHDNVHVLIGDPTNMGSVQWAARDPIFWLHHCNLDRIWASWNKAGRSNPGGSWLSQRFVFADRNGGRVDAKVEDFGDPETIAAAPYTYDTPVPVPALTAIPVAALVASSAPVPIAQQAEPGPVSVTQTRDVALAPIAGVAAADVQGTAGRIFLVLQNLQATLQPGVVYRVSLKASPAGAAAVETRVGAINFFASVADQMNGMAGMNGGGSGGSSFSFDVTDALANPAFGQGLPSVQVAALGTPKEGAQPQIGSIGLVKL